MKKFALPGSTVVLWKILQAVLWLAGIVLLIMMFFKPPLGVTLFWNILIPVAPALLVVATGIWRNICPLATTALLPDRLGLSKKKKISSTQQTTLQLVGVIALFLIIPFRHLLFNVSGQATALIIISLAAVAILYGFVFERKSAWCSGICPVHPVEKLYGSGVVASMYNAHCSECVRCSTPCPDSTRNYTPVATGNSSTSLAVELLLVGAFPGYIWGWFQVPDYTGTLEWQNLIHAFTYPVVGGTITFILYAILREHTRKSDRKLLLSIFAATAVSCYYWFRLPMLFGFSALNTNGTLVDLTAHLHPWSIIILNLATTAFFFWWMVLRPKPRVSWAIRPHYADHKLRV